MNRKWLVGGMAVIIFALTPGAPGAWSDRQPDQPADKAGSARSVDLRPKFVRGQDIKFKMTMRSRGLTGDRGTTDTADESSQEMVLRLKVKETNPETGSTLELVYEQLKVHMGEVEFDSTKPAKAGDAVDDLFRSIVGLKMNVQMDPSGNISSVTSDSAGGGVGDLLSQQFTGADVIKGLFGPISTRQSDDGRATIGESWKTEDVMQGGIGSMRLAMTHTLESATRSRAIIKTKGRVALDGSEGAGLGIKIKDSVINGTTEWDLESGMLSRMTQDNRIEVEAPDANGAMKPKTHSMKVEVTRVR